MTQLYVVEAMGIKAVQTRLTRMGEAALSARPAFETIAGLAMRIEAAVFDSQGRRGGGSWRRDTPEWMSRKLREGLDPRINHATLALRQSVTLPGAPGQVLEISDSSMRFGSKLPYAEVAQRERPFIKFSAYDRATFRHVVRDHLINAWNSAL